MSGSGLKHWKAQTPSPKDSRKYGSNQKDSTMDEFIHGLAWRAFDAPTKPVEQETTAEKALVIFLFVTLILVAAWLEGSWI